MRDLSWCVLLAVLWRVVPFMIWLLLPAKFVNRNFFTLVTADIFSMTTVLSASRAFYLTRWIIFTFDIMVKLFLCFNWNHSCWVLRTVMGLTVPAHQSSRTLPTAQDCIPAPRDHQPCPSYVTAVSSSQQPCPAHPCALLSRAHIPIWEMPGGGIWGSLSLPCSWLGWWDGLGCQGLPWLTLCGEPPWPPAPWPQGAADLHCAMTVLRRLIFRFAYFLFFKLPFH